MHSLIRNGNRKNHHAVFSAQPPLSAIKLCIQLAAHIGVDPVFQSFTGALTPPHLPPRHHGAVLRFPRKAEISDLFKGDLSLPL